MLKSIKKYGLYLILAQTFVLICAAQTDLPSVSTGDIQFYVDDASFSSNNKVYQEIYIMIFADQLKLTNKNNSQYADLSLSLSIKKSNGEYLFKESWDTQAEVIIDTSEVGHKAIYDQWSKYFEAGVYKLELEVHDNIGGKSGTVRKEIEVRLQSEEKFFFSEIEFASEVIPQKTSDNIFNKGNISVIPNPSRRYGLLNPVMYFYYEIYDLENKDSRVLKINYEVESTTGTSLRSFDEKTIKISGASSGFPNGLNVSALASGIYFLSISAVDTLTKQTIKTRRAFEVIQIDYLEKSPVLTEEQAEMFGEIIRLISTEKNYELYEGLNLGSKAKFLVEFWKQNDPDPTTDENELFKRIMQRYQYANDNFSWGKINGWKTDRGKVLIENGMPDNIIHHPSEEATFAYEIWEYQERRSYIFVFGDLRNDGRYTLLHSNKEEEIYNPYWKDELNRM